MLIRVPRPPALFFSNECIDLNNSTPAILNICSLSYNFFFLAARLHKEIPPTPIILTVLHNTSKPARFKFA